MTQQSLADLAVEALAAVAAMSSDVGIDHPERHVVRNLKRIATKTIEDAMRTALDLSCQAKDLRDLHRELKAATPPAAQEPKP
jgi:hypothetical protein